MSNGTTPALVAELIDADQAYRNGKPTMADEAYDVLQDRALRAHPEFAQDILRLRETEGLDGARQIRHYSPMGSLEKESRDRAVALLATRNHGIDPRHTRYAVTQKIDGASLALTYIDGKLQHAATRGDGTVGREVTDVAARSPAIPVELNEPRSCVIRGELCLSWDDLDDLNATTRRPLGKDDYNHPRNATVGIMNSGEGAESLRFKAFGLELLPSQAYPNIERDAAAVRGSPFTRSQIFDRLGFKHADHQQCWAEDTDLFRSQVPSPKEIIGADGRTPDNVPCDGLVVEIYSNAQMARHAPVELSDDGRYTPSNMMAVKLDDQSDTARLQWIEWSPGRHKLTPVAHIEPTSVDGAVISQVILKSPDFVERHELRSGDTLEITRAGGVIPKVVGVEHNPDNTTTPSPAELVPTSCEVCKAPTERAGNTLCCTNADCPGKLARRAEVGLKLLGVKGFGYKTLLPLTRKIRTNITSLLPYMLDLTKRTTRANIGSMCRNTAGLSEKNWEKVADQIEAALPFDRAAMLAACAIPHLGANTIKSLFPDGVPHLDELRNTPPHEWAERTVRQRRLGHSRGYEIADALNNPSADTARMLDLLERENITRSPALERHEAELQQQREAEAHEGRMPSTGFPYRNVCLTGKPPDFAWLRADIESELRAHGAVMDKSVKDTTELLVMGDPNSTTRKAQQARANGTKIMSYAELRHLFDECNREIDRVTPALSL